MSSNTGRPPALLLLLWLIVCACFWSSISARPSYGVKLQSQYLRAIGAYRRLERSLPPQELRALTALGLLNGARLAEEQMQQHLAQEIKELLEQSNSMQQDDNKLLPKIDAIEQQLVRDQRALSILTSAMEVLSRDKNEQQFRQLLKDLFREQLQKQQQHLKLQQTEEQPEVSERLGQLRLNILQQVPQMKSQLEAKIEKALEHLVKDAPADGPIAKASHKVLDKRAAKEQEQQQNQQKDRDQSEKKQGTQEPEEKRIIKSILSEDNQLNTQDDFRENLVMQQHEINAGGKRQTMAKDDIDELDELSSQNVTVANTTITKANQGTEEIGGDDFGNGGTEDMGAGGGLVGLIGSLSGGEGGSDVGALIGALTGLISTLFGPGGLDIESLISTGTSLISGLLSGNKNFGVVLGNYVGTAFDGLSGGGGAINNGLFVGNFVGTVLAALSADPEEEGPPQPLIFTKNFLSGFLESKFRPVEAESESRHGSHEKKKKESSAVGGFDSGGFVKQIASHLVSSVLGLILNASAGALGGASHASTGLFSSSSHHTKPAVSH